MNKEHWKFMGYYSTDLKPKSNKLIVKVCDECGKYQVIRKAHYKDLCGSCANKGKCCSEETKRKISKGNEGKHCSNKTKIKISCANQGISIENWDGFVQEIPYCPKFNDKCRELNRNKYNNKCFICNKSEIENNNRKLSVHHIDMNKNQGCDDNEWALVPVCSKCHGIVHNDLWKSRIEYLLNNIR